LGHETRLRAAVEAAAGRDLDARRQSRNRHAAFDKFGYGYEAAAGHDFLSISTSLNLSTLKYIWELFVLYMHGGLGPCIGRNRVVMH
jgi:hypothetical protein